LFDATWPYWLNRSSFSNGPEETRHLVWISARAPVQPSEATKQLLLMSSSRWQRAGCALVHLAPFESSALQRQNDLIWARSLPLQSDDASVQIGGSVCAFPARPVTKRDSSQRSVRCRGSDRRLAGRIRHLLATTVGRGARRCDERPGRLVAGSALTWRAPYAAYEEVSGLRASCIVMQTGSAERRAGSGDCQSRRHGGSRSGRVLDPICILAAARSWAALPPRAVNLSRWCPRVCRRFPGR
jgi:hypothetical protein